MLRTWHGWLFILTAMLMVIVMGATLRMGMLMEQSVQWVLHSDEIMARFLQLRANLSEAESSERAYLITGDAALLERSQEPRKRVMAQLADLRTQTTDNDHQQGLLNEMDKLVSARFEKLDKAVQLRKTTSDMQILSPLVYEGSNIMQALLQRMEAGLEGEAKLFAEREAARREQLRSMNITTIGSGLLALGTAVAGLVLLRRTQKEALRAATFETQKVRAERSDHMKSRFLANMSHEIRTPMNAILGFTELLADSNLSERDHGYVKSIQASGQSLLELINDVLDLSRLEAGRMPLHLQPLDLREMVESVKVVLGQNVQTKGISLASHVTSGVPPTVLLDGLRVRQVLFNLVSNAVKFTSHGGITIELLGTPAADAGPFVDITLRVSDTGVGISAEDQERIFSAFEQAAASEAHAAQGTGLGLSITHRLVEIMGGQITVASELGAGSTFTVVLPRIAIGATPEPHDETQVCDLNLIRRSRILVVDDLASNRDVIAGFFNGSHHDMLFACDGLEAMEKAHQGKPDLILMDVRMPGMDGTWARQLLKDDEGTKHIPVVAQTASSMAGESERLKKFFDGYLRKPFTRAQLFQALSAHLPMTEAKGAEPAVAASTARLESNGAPVSTDQAAAWERLAADLRTTEASAAARLAETLPMLEIAAFARQLRVRADTANCQPIRQYVDALLRAADVFDLEAVERQLKDFPALLSRLAIKDSSA